MYLFSPEFVDDLHRPIEFQIWLIKLLERRSHTRGQYDVSYRWCISRTSNVQQMLHSIYRSNDTINFHYHVHGAFSRLICVLLCLYTIPFDPVCIEYLAHAQFRRNTGSCTYIHSEVEYTKEPSTMKSFSTRLPMVLPGFPLPPALYSIPIVVAHTHTDDRIVENTKIC